jgi:hypothetical protein
VALKIEIDNLCAKILLVAKVIIKSDYKTIPLVAEPKMA